MGKEYISTDGLGWFIEDGRGGRGVGDGGGGGAGWKCEVGREGEGELRKGGGRRALGKDGRIGKGDLGDFGG